MVDTAARLSLLFLLLAPSLVCAHPPGTEAYDRTIVVRLTPRQVIVDYTLMVDGKFAEQAILKGVTLAEIRAGIKPDDLYERYKRDKLDEVRAALLARLDGTELTLACTRSRWSVSDHLKCEFHFEANWTLKPNSKHEFTFRDATFDGEEGIVDLLISFDDALLAPKVIQPDAALKKNPTLADKDRLREASATIEWMGGEAKPETTQTEDAEPTTTTKQRSTFDLIVMLGLAFVLGAGHALTPGHGKTLVAAYLVGERGTFGHAVLLGVVTTLTHTGIILLIAAVLPLIIPSVKLQEMQQVLGFVAGVLVIALGFWLFQRRLAGQADHFHIGGGHHHHHHEGDHHHHHLPPGDAPGTWGLIALGITGGIVPCGEAMVLFVAAIGQNPGWAFFILLSFSVGLASVLVAIGLGVVYAKRWTAARLGESPRLKRIARALPIVSAVVITLLGIWLCYQSIHHPSH